MIFIDFTIPYDTKIDVQEVEKIQKQLDLTSELNKVWSTKVIVVPLIVAALATPVKAAEERLKTIGIRITELQKTVLINATSIVRKVLEL